MMMKYGINALGLLAGGKRGGVGNYIYNLVAGLAGLNSSNDISVYVRNDYHGLDWVEESGIKLKTVFVPSRPRGVQFAGRVYTEQFLLARRAAHDNLDILHFPDHVGVVWRGLGCAQVVTIPDLTVFSHGETHNGRTRTYMRYFIPRTVRVADQLICISRSTADDLCQRFPWARPKVRTVHLAAGDQYKPQTRTNIEPILNRLGLERAGYLLFLGTIEPRKNVEGLLKAYALASSSTSCPPLVLAGKIGHHSEGIPALVEKLGIAGRVRFLGFVSDEESVALYSGAVAFVYPSFYEGFGLPILEAMACGAPVITSTVSSMPEVAGSDAVLVPPDNIRAIADAISLLVTDGNLRLALCERGKNRAKKFSWRKCAQETLDVCEDALQERSPKDRLCV